MADLAVWTKCRQCLHLEGWIMPDDILRHVFPTCELCGCPDLDLADYDPDRTAA